MSLIKVTRKFRKGMGLIEVLGALTLSVVALTALVSMVIYAMRSSLQSQLMLEGTNMANEQLENMRLFRNASTWVDFKTAIINAGCRVGSDTYCQVSCSVGGFGNVTCSIPNYSGTNPIGISGLETTEGLYTWFQAEDASATPPSNQVTPTTTIVRVTATSGWQIGSDRSTSVTTDFSNWQGK
jgi:hypothetical protein